MNDIFGPGSNLNTRFAKTFDELKEKVSACRVLGKKVVLTSGAWDILHIGHCAYMEAAKKSAGVELDNVILVVGVDSDEKIRAKKGKNRPVVPQEERLEILCHIRHVDIVFLKNLNDEKWTLIKAIKPDVLIVSKRNSYTEDNLVELKKYCGEVLALESQATTSTTAKIRLLIVGVIQEAKQNLNVIEGNIKGLFDDFRKVLDQLSGGGG